MFTIDELDDSLCLLILLPCDGFLCLSGTLCWDCLLFLVILTQSHLMGLVLFLAVYDIPYEECWDPLSNTLQFLFRWRLEPRLENSTVGLIWVLNMGFTFSGRLEVWTVIGLVFTSWTPGVGYLSADPSDSSRTENRFDSLSLNGRVKLYWLFDRSQNDWY